MGMTIGEKIIARVAKVDQVKACLLYTSVRKVKFNGRIVEHEVIRGINVYMICLLYTSRCV